MCTFEYKVLLCGCENADCPQRTKRSIEANLPARVPGHILRITQVYRVSGLCLGFFYNTNPNRLVLRWGFPADNSNSTQDCKSKKFMFHKEFERGHFCDKCLETCDQPASVALLMRARDPASKAERQRRGLEVKPDVFMMDFHDKAEAEASEKMAREREEARREQKRKERAQKEAEVEARNKELKQIMEQEAEEAEKGTSKNDECIVMKSEPAYDQEEREKKAVEEFGAKFYEIADGLHKLLDGESEEGGEQ